MKKFMFYDKMNVEQQSGKKVISVRDGIQTYYGMEIGKEPFDKVFKVYRKPETIKETAKKMIGIPVTDEHIELEPNISEDKKIGEVLTSKIIPLQKEEQKSTIGIENKIALKKNMVELGGKNQLSLGYFADLIDGNGEDYDLEQVNIQPHHLAIVNSARCGNDCKFKDKGELMAIGAENNTPAGQVPENNPNGENGNGEAGEKGQNPSGGQKEINLQKIGEVITDLPDAIKLMDLSELKKIIPILQDAINKAKQNTPELQEENMETGEENDDPEGTGEENGNGEAGEDNPKPSPTQVTDAQDFKDTKEFKDAVMQYGNARASIILKAKSYLDESYKFEDKDNLTIMKEVLAKETKEKFTDNEIPVAFKMLKKIRDYSKFADAQEDEFSKLKEKEL